jgi:NADH:ubiquinone oxidoreductase subunit E
MNKGDILGKYPPSQEYILHILHALQDSNVRNYLSEDDLKLAADYLSIPYSSVYGVASYYTMFSLKPRGRHLIRVCHSPVCEMLNASSLIQALQDMLGVEPGETTRDGLFTLEHTECLGQCDKSPVMLVDEELHTRVTPKKGRGIIEQLRRESMTGDVSGG